MELTETQKKCPLSRRKFWKKITRQAILPGIVFLIPSAVALIVMLGFGSENQSGQLLVGIIIETILIYIALFFLLFLLPYGLYVHIYIQSYYYSLDENFITIRKGVLTPTEINVQYLKVQDVYVDQDIFDRIFGIFDVHISSATISSKIEAHIDGLSPAHAEALKNELLQKIQNPQNQNLTNPIGVTAPNTNPEVIAKLVNGISSTNFPIQARWLVSVVVTSVSKIFFTLLLLSGYFVFRFSEESATSPEAVGDSEYSFYVYLGYVVILLLTIVGRLGYSIWWKSNYYFEFQPEYIVLKQGVISTEERNIQYNTIQNVTLKQRITDRVLGICDVVIENASAGGQGLAIQPGAGLAMGVMGSNGIIIPGQLLSSGKQLVEIVNKITIEKNLNLNSKGL